jgi:polyhydroxyalkanoate synthesis regulator phasin
MKKWFYIDITTTCHERVAVKAEDEEQAKDIVGTLVDTGTINPARAYEFAYGSVDDSITIAEHKFKRPPKAMRKFEWVHSARAAEE